MTVDREGLSIGVVMAHHPLTRFFHCCLPRNPVSRCTYLTFSVQRLNWHRHLEKEPRCALRGGEDDVEFTAVELALGRQHALEVVRRKCDLGPSREKGRARLALDPGVMG